MRNSIGLLEAKTHFSQIIKRVMYGEEIFITRYGITIAKLIPAKGFHDSVAAKGTVKRLRGLAKEMNLGEFNWEEWKTYRDTGSYSFCS